MTQTQNEQVLLGQCCQWTCSMQGCHTSSIRTTSSQRNKASAHLCLYFYGVYEFSFQVVDHSLYAFYYYYYCYYPIFPFPIDLKCTLSSNKILHVTCAFYAVRCFDRTILIFLPYLLLYEGKSAHS